MKAREKELSEWKEKQVQRLRVRLRLAQGRFKESDLMTDLDAVTALEKMIETAEQTYCG